MSSLEHCLGSHTIYSADTYFTFLGTSHCVESIDIGHSRDKVEGSFNKTCKDPRRDPKRDIFSLMASAWSLNKSFSDRWLENRLPSSGQLHAGWFIGGIIRSGYYCFGPH